MKKTRNKSHRSIIQLIPAAIIIVLVLYGYDCKVPERYISVPETIINNGIPPIPIEIKTDMDPYLQASPTYFAGWSPGGKGIFVRARKGNTYQLFKLSKPGGKLIQLTHSDEPVSNVIICPDSTRKYLIYSRDIDGKENYQFYLYNTLTEEIKLITGGKYRNLRPGFNHSGTMIAFASNERTGVLEDMYVMDPEKPESKRLVFTSQRPSYLYPFGWFYDNVRLLLLEVISINKVNTYVVNTETCEYTMINKDDKRCFYGMIYASAYGDYLIGRTDCSGEFQRLAKRNYPGDITKILAADINWDAENIIVSNDFSNIAFITNEDGIDKLYLMNPSSFDYKKVDKIPEGQISGLKFSPDENEIGFTLSSHEKIGEVFSYNIKTDQLTKWTNNAESEQAANNIIKPEIIYYPTFDTINGKLRNIPSYYFKPPSETKKPYPVVIYIHGGPEGQFVQDYDPIINYWTQQLGIAVLAPNVRGSSGYGKTYLLLDNGKKREDAVRDIGALLEWISINPEIDNNRIGVYGASYGGYMVLSAMFHYSNQIACGIDIVGISNFNTFMKNTSPYRVDFRREEYGDERILGEFLDNISPLTHADKITSPLFVIQGKNDPRVPWTEAEQIVRSVRKNNVPVWYQLLANEGHSFTIKNNIDYVNYSVVEFLRRYLL